MSILKHQIFQWSRKIFELFLQLVKRSETTMDEFQLIDKYFKKLTKNNIC